VLRRDTLDDAEALSLSITESIEHLRPYMAWIAHEPATIERRRELIAGWNRAWDSGGDLVFSMFFGDKLVGGCGLHRRRGHDGLEIGYWVHPSYTGRGFATRAAGALTSAAFTLPHIELVEIHHDKSNVASQRVPAKLGYQLCGEEYREALAPADTGTDLVWRTEREDWLSRGDPQPR
jgi:RimJ/RimL family protein N-acetyltransferase